jgi:hypothetical protein
VETLLLGKSLRAAAFLENPRKPCECFSDHRINTPF